MRGKEERTVANSREATDQSGTSASPQVLQPTTKSYKLETEREREGVQGRSVVFRSNRFSVIQYTVQRYFFSVLCGE